MPFLLARRIGVDGGWKASVHHWGLLQQLVGSSYVWAGLLVVGYAAWRLRRPAGPPEGDVWTPDRRGVSLT